MRFFPRACQHAQLSHTQLERIIKLHGLPYRYSVPSFCRAYHFSLFNIAARRAASVDLTLPRRGYFNCLTLTRQGIFRLYWCLPDVASPGSGDCGTHMTRHHIAIRRVCPVARTSPPPFSVSLCFCRKARSTDDGLPDQSFLNNDMQFDA